MRGRVESVIKRSRFGRSNRRLDCRCRSETPPSEHLDGEEVGTCKYGHVRGDEISPGGILVPLGCRLDAVSAKDVANRLIANGVAEIGQGSDDAVVSPAGVLWRSAQ